MRRVEFKKSFDRTYQKLSPKDQLKVDQAVEKFLKSLEDRVIPQGVGLKRLQDDQWEMRVDLSLRVAFRMHKDLVEFAMVGDHEAIKKFLKNI